MAKPRSPGYGHPERSGIGSAYFQIAHIQWTTQEWTFAFPELMLPRFDEVVV